MRLSAKFQVAIVIALVAAALAASRWIYMEYGPGQLAEPGVAAVYVCAECGKTERFEYDELRAAGAEEFDDTRKCPRCESIALHRAERCSACGELIPAPPAESLPEAICPSCGEEIFGPLGGRPVDKPVPRKAPEEERQW